MLKACILIVYWGEVAVTQLTSAAQQPRGLSPIWLLSVKVILMVFSNLQMVLGCPLGTAQFNSTKMLVSLYK